MEGMRAMELGDLRMELTPPLENPLPLPPPMPLCLMLSLDKMHLLIDSPVAIRVADLVVSNPILDRYL